ncbi:hypothetical protein [Neobacillus niacini]|uniref:hypothetical protein n=1 Tax=Neobacillus niacini TaxID=86668 RepID=UPI00285C2FEE|nr:hypothetical protein [Neobacillus niacini]MDR7000306.1 hypothetical protein [Neobacillus niacini]
MKNKNETSVTGEMLIKYYELNKQKKEIELEMNRLKESFQQYFDQFVGENVRGEITISGYKLQRQIRNIEKYNDEVMIKRLEELQMNDLIQIIKKPDDVKIKAALQLGLLNQEHLDGCMIKTSSPAISVKPLTPR